MFTLQVPQLPAYNIDISSHSVTPRGPYTISYGHFRCVNTRRSWSGIYSGSRLPLLTWSATKRPCRSACKLYYGNMHGISANIHRVSANTHGVSAIMQRLFKQHFGLMWMVSMSMAMHFKAGVCQRSSVAMHLHQSYTFTITFVLHNRNLVFASKRLCMQLQAEYGKSKMHYFSLIDAASRSTICCLLYTSNILSATDCGQGECGKQQGKQILLRLVGTEQESRH